MSIETVYSTQEGSEKYPRGEHGDWAFKHEDRGGEWTDRFMRMTVELGRFQEVDDGHDAERKELFKICSEGLELLTKQKEAHTSSEKNLFTVPLELCIARYQNLYRSIYSSELADAAEQGAVG